MAISQVEALRRGIRLEVATITWMAVEAALAIGAGVAARSILLTAFGVDSVVELLSGVALFRMLAGGTDRHERRTVRISAILLVALCAYVVLSSIAGLVLRVVPDGSVLGAAVCAAAVIAMPALANAKTRVNVVL